MNVITCDEMKQLEKRADASGLSYYQMMENAGTAAAEIIADRYAQPLSGSRVLAFCGKGNNGGDGFVVARKFSEKGAKVTIFLVDGEPATKDAVTNLDLIRDQVDLIDMKKAPLPFTAAERPCQIIIDAIYGTGFHGRLGSNALTAAAFINQCSGSSLTCSLDIPSGLSGDMVSPSELDTRAVRSHCTITFHAGKPVHLQPFAAAYCGEIIIADIGIREADLESSDL